MGPAFSFLPPPSVLSWLTGMCAGSSKLSFEEEGEDEEQEEDEEEERRTDEQLDKSHVDHAKSHLKPTLRDGGGAGSISP